MIPKCPGQDDRNLKTEILKCSDCGYEVEIFSDEIKVKCPKCKNLVCRQRLPSCVDWCKHARECVGDQYYNSYIQNKFIILKEKLIRELEAYFGKDAKRINHAKKVMGFAEELLKQEKADWHIVIPASILHDVGIKVAEAKYGSSAGHYQEKEGPEVAKNILLKAGLKKEDIDQICQIIAHHHSPGKIDTQNFKVLCDADWLVNLNDEVDTKDKIKLKEIIDRIFITGTGKELAKKIYLEEASPDDGR